MAFQKVSVVLGTSPALRGASQSFQRRFEAFKCFSMYFSEFRGITGGITAILGGFAGYQVSVMGFQRCFKVF